MWLEDVLLNNPDIKGCFTVSTSYRNEPNPVECMIWFSQCLSSRQGGQQEMIQLEKELLEHIGFTRWVELLLILTILRRIIVIWWLIWCSWFGAWAWATDKKDYGPVLFLRNFLTAILSGIWRKRVILLLR